MAVKRALIKKDLTEKFSQYKGKNKDVGGILLNIILTLFIAGVFIIGVSFIAKTYINVKIGFISNKLERVYEILTLFFALQVVLLAISGVSKLNKNLIEVSNISLLAMPITPFQIYISKMVSVYLKLFLSSIIMTIPMFVMLVVWSLLPWQSILIAIIFMP